MKKNLNFVKKIVAYAVTFATIFGVVYSPLYQVTAYATEAGSEIGSNVENKPDGQTSTEEKDKSDETTKPADPSKSDETTKPADPSKSDETAKPADPSKSDETTKPADPSKSDETTKPADPSKSDETTKPADPSKSDETTKPADPTKPEDTKVTEESKKDTLKAAASTVIKGEVTVTQQVDVSDDSGFTSEELFDAYAGKVLGMYQGISLYSLSYAGARLDECNKKLYDVMKENVTNVANGTASSANFSITSSQLGITSGMEWSATALGLSLSTAESETQEGQNQIANAIINNGLRLNSNMVMKALQADCPYELYWFLKTQSNKFYTSTSYEYTAPEGDNPGKVKLNSVSFRWTLPVSSDFRPSSPADDYAVDTAKTGAAKRAAENINSFISSVSGLSDIDKLRAYKDKICSLTTYNTAASKMSDDSIDNISPWQLIYVFDGDPSTNVVCEGYSKAFAYLCEKSKSSFTDGVQVYTVSGTTSGPHMWNIVHIGGKNYLVDVTNCDEGAAGYPDKRFMKGSPSTVTNGYVVDGTTYTYDSDTLGTYSAEELDISETDYGEDDPVDPDPSVKPEVTITPTGTAHGTEANAFDGSVTLKVGVTPTEGISTLKYQLDDAAAADVPENNEIVIYTPGSHDITVIATNSAGKQGYKTYAFKIYGNMSIEDQSKSYKYTVGSKGDVTIDVAALLPSDARNVRLEITKTDADSLLSKAEVSGTNVVFAVPALTAGKVGKSATINVTVKADNYKDASFAITIAIEDSVKKAIDGAVVTLGDSLTYTGSAQTMTVSSVVLDGSTLTVGTDYEVTGATNTNVGTYTLTITGKGDYTGTVTKEYSIAQAKAEITVGTTSYSKFLGDASFTLNVTKKGEGTLVFNSTNPSVASVTGAGLVEIHGVGTTTITINHPATTNYTAADQKTVTITVTKKSYTAAPIEKTYFFKKAALGERISVTSSVPTNMGAATFTLVSGVVSSGDADSISNISVGNGYVTLDILGRETFTENTYKSFKINVDSANYLPFTIDVKITRVNNCDHPSTKVKTVVDVKATCEAKGKSHKVCEECGTIIDSNIETAALGHAWDNGTVLTPSTTTTKGVRLYTCKNDSTHTRKVDIPLLPVKTGTTTGGSTAKPSSSTTSKTGTTTTGGTTSKTGTTTTGGTTSKTSTTTGGTTKTGTTTGTTTKTGTTTGGSTSKPSGSTSSKTGSSSKKTNTSDNKTTDSASDSENVKSENESIIETVEEEIEEFFGEISDKFVIDGKTFSANDGKLEGGNVALLEEADAKVKVSDGNWSKAIDKVKDLILEVVKDKSTAVANGNGEEGVGEAKIIVVSAEKSKVIPSDFIDAIAGQPIIAVLDMGSGIMWTINGESINFVSGEDIDFSVLVGEEAAGRVPQKAKDKIAKDKKSIDISLMHDGAFNATVVLTVPVSVDDTGKYAYLYYFNPDTEKLEYADDSVIHEDGTADFTFTHASDYTIFISDEAIGASSAEAPSRVGVIIANIIIILVAAGIAFFIIYRRRVAK